MTSNRKRVTAGLLACGALLTVAAGISITSAQSTTPTTTTAAPPAGPHGHGPWGIYGKLNLTSEQQASIKAIFTAAKPQMQSLHAQAKANHLKMMQTTPDDPNYATIVAEVAQANATLASQRTTQESEIKAQIYAVLTATQKTQLATLEAQWADKPHHGHWGHRPPPPPAAE